MQRNQKLADAVADAGMSEFVRQVKYKSDWQNREVVQVSRWFASTQICSECGVKNEHMAGFEGLSPPHVPMRRMRIREWP